MVDANAGVRIKLPSAIAFNIDRANDFVAIHKSVYHNCPATGLLEYVCCVRAVPLTPG